MDTPDSLKKIGLTGIKDNLHEGQQVQVKGALFMAFFGDELLRALSERQGKQSDRNGSQGGL